MAVPEEQDGRVMYSRHWAGRKLSGDLSDFRNNGMSAGLDGASTRQGQMNVPKTFEFTLLHVLYAQLYSVAGREFMRDMLDVGCGNPSYIEHQGMRLTVSDLQAVFNAWRIKQLCNPRHIVEIGPGFGALAVMLRRLFPDAAITLVDLPEHKDFQEYYIDHTVGLTGFEVTTELPKHADMVVALRCMMEFSDDELQRYFSWIQGLSTLRYFYLITRYWKWTALKKYPFDKRWRPLISQTMWPTCEMHELMLERVDCESDVLGNQLKTFPPFTDETVVMDYKVTAPVKAALKKDEF